MNTLKEQTEYKGMPLLVFAVALTVSLFCALPGACDPALLMRPDSYTYLEPAVSIMNGDGYADAEGVPTALRVPAYSLFLVLTMRFGGSTGAVFGGCVLFALTAMVIYGSCRAAGAGNGASLFGASVFALTPTPLAFAPMFLSETLFVLWTALEGFSLIQYFRTKRRIWLVTAALAGGIAVMTRPLNLLWILPCLFAAGFVREISFRRKIWISIAAFLLFCAVFVPWILRNHAIGSGWRIDAVSADSLKHNAAIVESRATGRDAGEIRRGYDEYFERVFQENPEDFPDEDSRLTFQEQKYTAVLKKYPLVYLTSFYRPVNFVPDVPTFLENLGLSAGGKGTADVIARDGLFAGIRHYFQDNTAVLLCVVPLCLLLLTGYVFAAAGFVLLLKRRQWALPLLFIPLWLYYMTVTGAVAYPRFSLPGLPFLCVLAAAGMQFLISKRRGQHAEIL